MIFTNTKHHVTLPRLKQLIAIFVMACTVCKVYSAEPVISSISIKGGVRGIALSIGADAPFEATYKSSSSKGQFTDVVVTLKNVVYGLTSYKYDAFASNVPVISITTVEKNTSSTVELSIRLNKIRVAEIQNRQVGNKCIALLSRDEVPEFMWDASVEQSVATVKNDVPESPAGADQVPLVSSDTDLKIIAPNPQVGTSVESASRLIDLRIVQNGKTQELILSFNKSIQCAVQQRSDTLLIAAKGVASSNGSKLYAPANNTMFSIVKVTEKLVGKGKALLVAVVLDHTKGSLSQFPSNFTGSKLVIYGISNTSRSTLWTIDNGSTDYKSYGVDTNSIKRRAVKDAQLQVDGTTFTIREDYQNVESDINPRTPLSVDEPQRNVASETTQKVVSVPEQAQLMQKSVVTPAPVVSKKADPLITIVKDVKLRTFPSTTGESKIITKFPIGSRLYTIKKELPWILVKQGTNEGWVYSELVCDSSKMTAEKWTQISKELQTPNSSKGNKSGVLQPDEITLQLPEETSSDLKNNLDADSEDDAEVLKGPKVVRYHLYGRDPFTPLMKDSLWESDLAIVENCKVSGILYDMNDRIVLLEDFKASNRAYALREADPVDNGRVLKIYKDKAVFLINDFGISRTYTLRLKRDPKKAGK